MKQKLAAAARNFEKAWDLSSAIAILGFFAVVVAGILPFAIVRGFIVESKREGDRGTGRVV